MKVVIYTSPACTYCQVVKIFLKRNKVEFQERDIFEDNKAAEELFKKTGQKSVPATFVGEKFVIGYDSKKLKEMLGI
jgi:glutaredoxin-like YruB-family protein